MRSEKTSIFQTSNTTIKKRADTIATAILERIRSGPKERVWTPQDFLDLGSRAAVDKALSRTFR